MRGATICFAFAVLLVSFVYLSHIENGLRRSFLRIDFAKLSFGVICCLLLLATRDLNTALLIDLYLVVTIGVSSRLKLSYLGTTLSATDVPLLIDNAPFLVREYRREMALAVGGLATITAVLAAAIAVAPPLPVREPVALASLAILGVAFAADYAKRRRQLGPETVNWHDCHHFTTFIRSLVDFTKTGTTMEFRELAGVPLDLDVCRSPSKLGADRVLPDIVLIQHESAFDPALYGLPVDDDVRAFLSPREALAGTLAVDVFGGGTVQTEFSILTGLSSLAFGAAAPLVRPLAPGRIHHALPRYLRSLGYDTSVIAAEVASTAARRFYAEMGFDRHLFVPERLPPFDVDRWLPTLPDDTMYHAALSHLGRRPERVPQFTFITTIMAHGPYARTFFGDERAERARATAFAATGNRDYAEYYSRLAAAATAYKRLVAGLMHSNRTRPTVFVRFGDHQPHLRPALPLPADQSRYRTFYAIEGHGVGFDRSIARTAPLDSAFLMTLALQAIGLPLDGFYSAHATLFEECGSAYDATLSNRKAAFHRSLVDAGLATAAATNIFPAKKSSRPRSADAAA